MVVFLFPDILFSSTLRSKLPLQTETRDTRTGAMGSFLGNVRVFVLVQCAMILVFMLEVADRLMYS